MKKLLVPTDFSTCADNAMDFAIQSAKIFPAEIILLHSFEVNGSVYTDYFGMNEEFNQSLLDDVEHKLHALKKSIQEKEDIIVSTKIYRGTVKDAVIETAITERADLIIMGTLGASGLKEKLWGSKTAAVIGNTYIPVMSIPFNYKWKKPLKMMVAINHFEKDSNLLDFIFDMAKVYTTQIEVVVFTDEDDDSASKLLENTRKIPQYEKLLQQQYTTHSITVSHIYGLVFEETIQQQIIEKEIDILVMITYQKADGFWGKLFNPSVTKKMSYHSTIPVLAIPTKYNQTI